MVDPISVGATIAAGHSALKLAKDLVGLIPDKSKKQEAELALKRVEGALELSNAEIAQKLGYELCQCTFPPQIKTMKNGNKQCPHGCVEYNAPAANADLEQLKTNILLLLSKNGKMTDAQIGAAVHKQKTIINLATDQLINDELVQFNGSILLVAGIPDSSTYSISNKGTMRLIENGLLNI